MLGSWDLEVGSFSYFGGAFRERGTNGFLKTKLHPFKTLSSNFWECCTVGAKCFMGVLRCLS